MENPFKFGGAVSGEDFADREAELNEILKEVRSGTNIVLFSPRRMGKSSLLTELARRHRKEFVFVYVDLYGIASTASLVEAFTSSLLKSAYGTAGKVAEGIKEVVRGSRLRLVISETGEPGIELAMGEPTGAELEAIMDLPEVLAQKRGRRIVVVFDEFQEISSLDGVPLLKIMRSRIQFQKHVSYIFTGSKRHLLMGIFEEREGAFFRSAKPMELGPIPREEFRDFLVHKFAASGGRLSDEAAEAVVDAGGGNAQYVQQIAHELFNISPKPKLPQDFQLAIEMTIVHQSPAFSYLWDSVKSPSQRRYLLAVAREGVGAKWAALVERYGLTSPSHIQRAVKQLDARGITEAGAIQDPMFAVWLRRLPEGRRPSISGPR